MEVAEFNVRVLIVEPGAFRTENIFSQPMYEGNAFEDYDKTREIASRKFDELNGKQPGDPAKAMEILADVVRGEGRAKGRPWPLYLPLGIETEQAIRRKFDIMDKVLEDWGDVIRDTRVDD